MVPYEKACIAGERRFGLKLPFPIRTIGQGRSSFHLSVLESVYIKTHNPVLCKQKDFIFSLGILKRYKFLSNNGNWANWPLLGPLRATWGHLTMCIRIWLYKFWITFRSLSDVSYSDEWRTKKAFQYVKKCCRFFVLY